MDKIVLVIAVQGLSCGQFCPVVLLDHTSIFKLSSRLLSNDEESERHTIKKS